MGLERGSEQQGGASAGVWGRQNRGPRVRGGLQWGSGGVQAVGQEKGQDPGLEVFMELVRRGLRGLRGQVRGAQE